LRSKSLSEIFDNWGTDKGQCAEGQLGEAEAHGYSGLYECLFYSNRSEIRTVLEIGIGTLIPDAPSTMVGWALPGYRPGGSLRAWREYFENATIFGLDIQPDTQFADESRIITRLCDSRNEAAVRAVMQDPAFPAKFDIIIDDASHRSADQIATLRNFFPYVAERGFYILEDISIGAFQQLVVPVKAICGDNPFFFLGPCNNVLVIMRRD